VSYVTRAWMAAARLRARRRRVADREALVREHASGRSFLDVGCMWSVDGAICFLAEKSGASAVTGVDLMPASARFEEERERRSSSVRFVQGDLHDADVEAHDVVWCFGVLYHVPNPVLTLERLRALTGEVLLLGTEVIPEVPGIPQACVFYPGLDPSARRAFAPPSAGRRAGLTDPFDAAEGYGNWWWGITPSALRGMLGAAGFAVESMHVDGLYATAVVRVLPPG
jgi:SAM-dependent methyltransferase